MFLNRKAWDDELSSNSTHDIAESHRRLSEQRVASGVTVLRADNVPNIFSSRGRSSSLYPTGPTLRQWRKPQTFGSRGRWRSETRSWIYYIPCVLENGVVGRARSTQAVNIDRYVQCDTLHITVNITPPSPNLHNPQPPGIPIEDNNSAVEEATIPGRIRFPVPEPSLPMSHRRPVETGPTTSTVEAARGTSVCGKCVDSVEGRVTRETEQPFSWGVIEGGLGSFPAGPAQAPRRAPFGSDKYYIVINYSWHNETPPSPHLHELPNENLPKLSPLPSAPSSTHLVHRLPLCDPGYHPNNRRTHVTRCRHTALDPPDSRTLLTVIHSRQTTRKLKPLSKRSAFPLALCSTRIVFLLLKQFSSELKTETEVSLTPPIKLIICETPGGPRSGWMMMLSMEIMRRLCSDVEFMCSVWRRYNALATGGDTGSASSAHASPSSYPPTITCSGSVAEMVVTAVSATMLNIVGMIGTETRLSVQTAAMKVQCIDQLDKADAPFIPEAYIYSSASKASSHSPMASQGIASLSKHPCHPKTTCGFNRARACTWPTRLDPTMLPEIEQARAGPQTVHTMLNAGWPVLLAAFFFLTIPRTFPTPRRPKRASGARLRHPTHPHYHASSPLNKPQQTSSASYYPVSLEELALGLAGGGRVVPYGHWDLAHACLRELVSSALFLTGTFGSSWFAVLEALQSADYVLTTRGTAPPGPAPLGIGAVTGGAATTETLGDSTSTSCGRRFESVQVAVLGLFDASIMLEDSAFHDFVTHILELGDAPLPIRAAHSPDEVLVIVPRDLMEAPSDLQATVQVACWTFWHSR
ncbi:hypothetical protein BGY98DRAFT_935195 [Russula aff. rugulosa BPL654]|nr:hypothetical protein BGY98DRAFT_935195 [Russula aff. rugulosa BPL654]